MPVRTEKDRFNDITGLALMTAFMTTTDVICLYADEGEDPMRVDPKALVGDSFGKIVTFDAGSGLSGLPLYEKWLEGLATVCEMMDGGLDRFPEPRKGQVGLFVTSMVEMTAEVFKRNYNRGPLGLQEAWLIGLDNCLAAAIPYQPGVGRMVRMKLKQAIDYGMEASRNDPLLPAAMQAGFTNVDPLGTEDADTAPDPNTLDSGLIVPHPPHKHYLN